MKHLILPTSRPKQTMRSAALIFTTFFLSAISFAQDVNFSWANAASTGTTNVKHVADASGNIYAIGGYQNTVDFNPGAGVYNLTSGGSEDIFISKTSPSGAFLWVKSIGASNYEQARSIALDPSGNILVTGVFNGTLDFNPGAGTYNLSSPSATAYFALKLDNSGNFIWAKSASGSQSCGGFGITSDASGNVYTTGYFTGTVDFDPGAGTFNLLATGGNDVFVQKLDVSGNFVWTKAFNSSTNFTPDVGRAISVDASGNVLITGVFHETVDFDPGAGTFSMTSSGSGDAFVSKLNTSGNFVWAKKLGGAGTSDDEGESIHFDASGNVYISGTFSGTVDFDPGPGTLNFTASAGSNAFLCKLDALGNLSWAKHLGTKNAFISDLDANGNFYVTGRFEGTVDVDPGPGTVNLPWVASNDVYACKMNNSGDLLWAKTIGGSMDEGGQSIAADGVGGVSVAGYFPGTMDFDPGVGVYNLTASVQSAFIQKLVPCQATGVDTITSCGSYTWINNVTYTTSNNTATHTIPGGAVSGCDSIVTLNLTVGDNQAPVPTLSSLADVTGVCSVGSLTAPTATDNCSGTVTVTNNATLPITAFGTTVVTWTYNDGNGNTSSQTQNVIITDNTAPVPTIATLADVNGVCSVGSLTAPTGTDNCGGTVTVTHNASLPITTIGTTVVTWTYDDGHGNTSTQTQNVVISNPVLGISIVSGSGNSICSGTSVTFTATATDGGSAPAYQWKVNGSNVGTNSSTYTTTTLNNNDVVTCVVTSNLSCNNGTTATSNSITMTVTPSPATSVSIVSNVGSSICAGNSVTFTATITNGGTPVYQWQVDGSNVGNNSPTFTTTTLTNGQTVTCLMTSSLTCANPAIAVSNAITMTVGSNATPTINITSNPAAATICSGVSVTFTANTTNGGATPTYQWKLNGNNVGTNASTYITTTLGTGDIVTCVLTSSSSCPTVTTVTSNSISKTVNQSVTPTITITSNPAMPVCEHGEVTFTATITNGGTNPDYQWKKNNQNYGIGNPTYSTTLWSNGDEFKCVLTSNATCAEPAMVISNIIITNELTPNPEVTVSGNTLTAEISGATYQWYNCTTNAPIPNATQQSYTATQSGLYSVLISAGGCSEESECQTINWNSMDELSENGIILYPNPANEYFIIDLPENTTMGITLFDIAGRKVMEGNVESSVQKIDIQSLVNGSYQLVLRGNSKEYFAKVIVNH